MMRARSALLLLLVASAAGCLGGGEQTKDVGPTGQIDGAVLDNILTPYSNVTVELVDLGWTTQTTDLGGFSFFDVPVGFHTLRVELEGIGEDRKVVAVEEDHVSKVILQVFPAPVDKPRVTALSDAEIVQIAMPGSHCEECEWTATMKDPRPEGILLEVFWDGRHPASSDLETHLQVELVDGDDRIIRSLDRDDVIIEDDLFVLRSTIPIEDIAAASPSLHLHFHFDEDNVLPHHDFRMESFMRLYYGETNETLDMFG